MRWNEFVYMFWKFESCKDKSLMHVPKIKLERGVRADLKVRSWIAEIENLGHQLIEKKRGKYFDLEKMPDPLFPIGVESAPKSHQNDTYNCFENHAFERSYCDVHSSFKKPLPKNYEPLNYNKPLYDEEIDRDNLFCNVPGYNSVDNSFCSMSGVGCSNFNSFVFVQPLRYNARPSIFPNVRSSFEKICHMLHDKLQNANSDHTSVEQSGFCASGTLETDPSIGNMPDIYEVSCIEE